MKISSAFKRFLHGFPCALQGIAYAVKTQVNFRFHLAAAVWALLLSRFYDFGGTEYAVILLTVSSVISLEAVNTAIEKAVDLASAEKHPLAKAAKDASAGAVLISAVFSVGVAFCLFWDKAVFAEIAAYFGDNPFMLIAAAAGAAVSVLFIFML